MLNISKNIKKIIEKLNIKGHQAYLVGGAVRNMLMGATPLDYDITTSAVPDEIIEIFNDYHIYTVGKAHGTIALLTDKHKSVITPLNESLPDTCAEVPVKIEITTMRTDGEYSDFRRPDSVSFTSELKKDLSRRDFTMNALALSLDGEVIDYFNGTQDIKNKIIRAVGDPKTRFSEDALRILRALRFACELGFEIEDKTRTSLFSKKELLNTIARERIAEEFLKVVCGKYAGDVILNYYEIIGMFVPEILACKGFLQKSKYHKYDVLEHICKSIDYIKDDSVYIKALKLAMFFHDIGKPFSFQQEGNVRHFKGHAEQSYIIAKRILKHLCFDKATTECVLFLVKYHDYPITQDQLNKKSIKRMLLKFGYERFRLLCEVKRADDMAKADFISERLWIYQKVLGIADEILAGGECLSINDLAVNGHDIIALGFEGKAIGRIKRHLLFEVIENNLQNKKDILQNFIDINRNLW